MNFVDLDAAGAHVHRGGAGDGVRRYINQDEYLSKHRGEYAERDGVIDADVPDDGPVDLAGPLHEHRRQRNAFQFRLDIQNFGNMLNSNWGVGVAAGRDGQHEPATAAADVRRRDAQNRPTYRLTTVTTGSTTELITKTYQSSATTSDVFQWMISLRYSFR